MSRTKASENQSIFLPLDPLFLPGHPSLPSAVRISVMKIEHYLYRRGIEGKKEERSEGNRRQGKGRQVKGWSDAFKATPTDSHTPTAPNGNESPAALLFQFLLLLLMAPNLSRPASRRVDGYSGSRNMSLWL